MSLLSFTLTTLVFLSNQREELTLPSSMSILAAAEVIEGCLTGRAETGEGAAAGATTFLSGTVTVTAFGAGGDRVAAVAVRRCEW